MDADAEAALPRAEGAQHVSIRGLTYRCSCVGCGGTFESDHPRRTSCSDECRTLARRAKYRRNRENDLAANARYKRRERARCSERERLRKAKIRPGHPQFVERVEREVVYAMHGGCCGICREFVAEDEFEVDHRVPLSRGGLHGYANAQPAHPACNRRKYNSEEER